MLGIDFCIEIGRGKKLFQITDHFIILRKLIPHTFGRTGFYSRTDYERFQKLTIKSKIFFQSAGILAQFIIMILIVVLLYLKIGTDYFILKGSYIWMIISSVILLLIVVIPNKKHENDSYKIFCYLKSMRKNCNVDKTK